jgi:AcrR family transcriptional regulator
VTDEGPVRALRRDAAENHERILASARELMREYGCDASMDAVARHAGVGAGTLYRHFPTKDALLDAILDRQFEQYVDFAEEGLRSESAFGGLAWFLERSVELQVDDRAFRDLVGARKTSPPQLERLRTRILPLLGQLVARAHAEGTLRPDVVAEDLPILLWEKGRIIDRVGGTAPDLWRRYLALTLDGLRASAATPLPRPPLSRTQLDDVLSRPLDATRPARPARRDEPSRGVGP